MPADGDLTKLVARVGESRGRPITLVKYRFPHDGPSGVWVSEQDQDYILVTDDASPCREAAIICHELGHIVLGHLGESLTETVAPDIDPGVAERFLARHSYQSSQERDAEAFGTLLAAEQARRIAGAAAAADLVTRRLR